MNFIETPIGWVTSYVLLDGKHSDDILLNEKVYKTLRRVGTIQLQYGTN